MRDILNNPFRFGIAHGAVILTLTLSLLVASLLLVAVYGAHLGTLCHMIEVEGATESTVALSFVTVLMGMTPVMIVGEY